MENGSNLTPEVQWLRYGRYPYLLAKLATFAVIAGAVAYAVHSIQEVLFPVALAMILAYVFDPAIDRFEARGYSRTSGILLFLAFGAAAVSAFVLFLYPTVARLISQIGEVLPRLADLVQHDLVPRIQRLAPTAIPADLESLLTQYGDMARQALPSVANGIRSALTNVWTQTGAIVNSALNLVLVPLLTFYFLRDFDVMRLAAVDYLPLHNRPALLERIAKMDEVVGYWIRGQLEVAAILAVMYAIGLGSTLGLAGIGASSGIAVGLLAGFLNVVPYFGFLVGILLSTLLVVVDWHGWWPLVGVGATFAIVQALEGYVVTPRIVGEKVGLSPVVVIISLLLGSQLLGVLGVVVALPLAGIARVLLPDLVGWYRESDLYTGHMRTTTAGGTTHVVDGGGVRSAAPGERDDARPREPERVGAAGEPVSPPGQQGDGGSSVSDSARPGPEPAGPGPENPGRDDGGAAGAPARSDDVPG